MKFSELVTGDLQSDHCSNGRKGLLARQLRDDKDAWLALQLTVGMPIYSDSLSSLLLVDDRPDPLQNHLRFLWSLREVF